MPHATTDDGVRLYFEETGSGRPLILVHEFAGGREHLERAIALYDSAKHRPLSFTYGINPRLLASINMLLIRS